MKKNNNTNPLFSKLITFAMVFGLMAGCASLTDANQESAETNHAVTETNTGDTIWESNGDDMDPIIDQPPPPTGR